MYYPFILTYLMLLFEMRHHVLIFKDVYHFKTLRNFYLILQIVLPPHVERIREKLAENIHELWVMNKIELGWTYGAVSIRQMVP